MALSDTEIKRLAQKALSLEDSAKGDDAIANLKEALRCYDQILSHCPNIAHYYHERGGVEFKLAQGGEWFLDSAIADIDKAIDLEPDKGDYYRTRGLYRLQWLRARPDTGMRQEESKLAMQDLKACISRNPSQPSVWLHLLVINLVEGDWDEVISVYGQCKPYIHAQEDRLMRSYFGCLALAFAGDAIEEEDIEPLRDESIRLKWLTLVEMTLSSIGRFFQTEQSQTKHKSVEEIIKLLMLHVDSWFAKGLYFDDPLGNSEESLRAYDKAITSGDNIVGAWNNKGNIYCRLRRYDEALEAFNRAAQLDPGWTFPITRKVRVLTQLGRYREALDANDQILAKEPEAAYGWADKSHLLIELGQFKDALRACETALDLEPGQILSAYTWNNMGAAYANLNRQQKALKCYENAVELDPENSLAASNRRKLLNKLKSKKESSGVAGFFRNLFRTKKSGE